MLFKPVDSTRIADQVFQQIKASIEAGQFKPGDALPGERILADQFKASRACVREALRVLEALGMVTVRQGAGCFVRSGSVERGSSPMASSIWVPWLKVHGDEVLALLDVREGLEIKAASLAAQRIDKEELRDLEVLLAKAQERVSEPTTTTQELTALDIEFHDLLARASKNDFLASLLSQIESADETDRHAIFAVPNRRENSLQEHIRILEAVKDGDPVRAAEAMKEHVDAVREAIRRLNGQVS